VTQLVRYIKTYQKQTFTWVDGLIDKEMAQKIRDAYFTDVVFRDRGSLTPDYDEALNVSNLHEVGLRAWGFIICPNHGEDFNSYFTSKKADYPHVDGFYVDDTQILFETGGDVAEWNQMVESAYSVLGADKDVVIEAVAGWNGKVVHPSQLIAKDFDYYANIDHNYTTDTWPQCTTKGIYVWLYKNASTVSKSQVEGIYTQAETLTCKRICVWQWYFAGESDATPEGCSICYYPELIAIITEQNKAFLGSLTTVAELEDNEKIPSFQFDKRAKAKGLDINIIQLTYTGLDPYKNPVYSEAVTTVKGFVRLVGQEKTTPAGTVELGKAVLMVSLTTVILKDGYEISYGGQRWKILAVDPRRSHLEVLAERKIEKEAKAS